MFRCGSIFLLVVIFILGSCGGARGGNGSVTVDEGGKQNPLPEVVDTIDESEQDVPVDIAPEDFAGQLDAALATYAAKRGGTVILLMKSGEVIYQGAIGEANTAEKVAVTGTTGFRIASVSKTFTALAVMQLVERGLLSLDDAVLTHIPELSSSWSAITIDMLLSHRSGVLDIVNDILPSTWLEGYTNDDALQYLQTHPTLEFFPASSADYSNSGYILLAEIIKRASGYTFADYMHTNIFEPAGMENSYIHDEHHPLRASDALGYGNRNTFYGTTTFLTGAMGQVSSAEDFQHFFTALNEHTLVSESTLMLMTQNQYNIYLFGRGYGYGFMLENNGYGHEGIWDGYRAKMLIDKQRDISFVVLSSSGSSAQSLITKVQSVVSYLE